MVTALSLLPLALLALVVVLVVRASRHHGDGAGPAGESHTVRRFFQYLLLFGLTVVAGIGAGNLLGRLFGSPTRSTPQYPGQDTSALLAQDLAFTVVGIPLAVLLAVWTWRTHRRDPDEARSTMYGLYVTVAALTGVVVALEAIQSLVADALHRPSFDADAAGRLVVWGAIWLLHWILARRTLPPAHAAPHLVLGSTIGLAGSAAGMVLVLGTALDLLLRPALVLGGNAALAEGVGLLLAGALVWVRYWVLGAAHLPRRTLWLVHVLPVGVGGGLVLALAGASLLLWDVLVWFLGEPTAPSAGRHFDGAANSFALVVVGVLVWWYHRGVLAEAGAGSRTEVRRVYEYLVSGIGLLAAAAGVGTLLVAVVEALTPGIDLGLSRQNTLLAAVTLLVVGVPVWWAFWRVIRRHVAADPPVETASRTRRVYLALLFGLAGVAAAIALIVAAVTGLQDVVDQQVSGVTLRSMRYALGVLVAAAAVSAYHGTVWGEDRTVVQARRGSGPRSVVLVGPSEPDLVHDVARQTGARVQVWGVAGPAWDRPALLLALAGHPGRDLLVLAEEGGPRVLEVERQPSAAR